VVDWIVCRLLFTAIFVLVFVALFAGVLIDPNKRHR
jgi:hypothetical protein